MCPRRFKYQYIEKKPGVLTSRLVAGTVYHNTLALALNHKKLGLPLDHNDIESAFNDFWAHELEDKVIRDEDGVPQIEATMVDWGKDDPEELKSNATRLAQKYNHLYVPKLNPIEVEFERNINVEGVPIPITGRLDLELSDRVVDHKFKGNALQKAALERDMQSMFYALLKGPPLIMEYHQAIEHMAWVKFPIDAGLVIATVTRTAGDVEWIKQLLREYWKQIENEIFPPNPTGYLCSIDWCPYYVDCKIEGE
jgi:hypothetical protein